MVKVAGRLNGVCRAHAVGVAQMLLPLVREPVPVPDAVAIAAVQETALSGNTVKESATAVPPGREDAVAVRGDAGPKTTEGLVEVVVLAQPAPEGVCPLGTVATSCPGVAGSEVTVPVG